MEKSDIDKIHSAIREKEQIFIALGRTRDKKLLRYNDCFDAIISYDLGTKKPLSFYLRVVKEVVSCCFLETDMYVKGCGPKTIVYDWMKTCGTAP